MGNDKIEVKQLDWHEPEIIPYKDGTVKLMSFKGKTYKSTGFQILEKGDDTILIRETYFKQFDKDDDGVLKYIPNNYLFQR